jgi:hypothetical protein
MISPLLTGKASVEKGVMQNPTVSRDDYPEVQVYAFWPSPNSQAPVRLPDCVFGRLDHALARISWAMPGRSGFSNTLCLK